MLSLRKRFWWVLLLVVLIPSGAVFQLDNSSASLSSSVGSLFSSNHAYPVTQSGQICSALLETALQNVSERCSQFSENTVCYVDGSVSSTSADENVSVQFETLFSRRDLMSIVAVDTMLGVSANKPGVALVESQHAGQEPLLMLMLGDVEIAAEPGTSTFNGADGLHFTLQTGPNSAVTCGNNQPPSLLMARSQNATLVVNGVAIQFAGLMALHTTLDGGLEVAIINGNAHIGATTISNTSAVSALLSEDGHTLGGAWSAPRALSQDELNLFMLAAGKMPAFSNDTTQATDTCTPREDWTIYVVPPGETLWRIASATGVSIATLKQANCMGEQDILRAGQRFHVPHPLAPLPSSIPATAVIADTPVPVPSGEGNNQGNNTSTSSGQTGSPPACPAGTPGCDDGNIGG